MAFIMAAMPPFESDLPAEEELPFDCFFIMAASIFFKASGLAPIFLAIWRALLILLLFFDGACLPFASAIAIIMDIMSCGI